MDGARTPRAIYSMEPAIRYDRRQPLDMRRLDALFVAAWGTSKPGYERVLAHSFTWVTASSGDELVGFANVAWDGGAHFFLLDTSVHPSWMRRGIQSMVASARCGR